MLYNLQQAKRITGNFTKNYEISRRDAQRFYYENWKMMKIHLRNHSINRNPYSVLMREHYIETMERIMMDSVIPPKLEFGRTVRLEPEISELRIFRTLVYLNTQNRTQ